MTVERPENPETSDDELDALAQTMGQPPLTPNQRAYHRLRRFYAAQAEQEVQALERVRQRLVASAASAAPRTSVAPVAPLPTGPATAQAPRLPRRSVPRWAHMRGIAAGLVVGTLLGGFGALLHTRQTAQPLTSYHFRIIPSPDTSLAVNTLTGITVRTSTDAWAWGVSTDAPTKGNSNPIQMPLVEHWDGQVWSLIANPSPRPFTSLGGVAHDPSTPGKVWIAGTTGPTHDGDQLFDARTLIETNQ
jgi:hypothetical protein